MNFTHNYLYFQFSSRLLKSERSSKDKKGFVLESNTRYNVNDVDKFGNSSSRITSVEVVKVEFLKNIMFRQLRWKINDNNYLVSKRNDRVKIKKIDS
jgi:hypothetical protein